MVMNVYCSIAEVRTTYKGKYDLVKDYDSMGLNDHSELLQMITSFFLVFRENQT